MVIYLLGFVLFLVVLVVTVVCVWLCKCQGNKASG